MPGIGELLGSLFGGVAGAQDGAHMRMLTELKPWSANLIRAATNKWLPRIASGTPCEVPNMRRAQKIGDCENLAVAGCMICRRPACLSHSYLNQEGDVVCYLCIGDAVAVVPPYQRKRAQEHGEEMPRPRSYKRQPPPPPPNNGAPPPKGGPTPLQIAQAFQALGLDPSASWSDVRSAHRKLSAQNHPDKHRTERAKKSAEARFKEVQMAFEVLKTQFAEAS